MSTAFQAALWGWFAGSSLMLGTIAGWYLKLPPRAISSVMAFGSGVLISAVSFELMDEAYHHGGFISTVPGFLAGILIYTLGARFVNKRGAKYRKRSGDHQKKDSNARAIAFGALLDGIPESLVIGLSLLTGKGPSLVTVLAIFISNVPEALSSSNGMKKAGRSKKYVFSLWSGIVAMSGISSFLGYTVFGTLSIFWISAITALSAGAILAMIVDTMIPEAFEEEGDWAGVVTGLGFIVAFVASKMSNQI